MTQQLDDPKVLDQLDPKGIFELANRFPSQCREGWRIAGETPFLPYEERFENVVLSGMGGSGSAGDFIQALFTEQGTVPFHVAKDYDLPNWVGKNTLVLSISYSGNTEETLSAFRQARARNAQQLVITSGGEIQDLADEFSINSIRIPGGQPPRMSLGYMLVPAIVALQRLELLPEQPLEAAISNLERNQDNWRLDCPTSENRAKQMAAAIDSSLLILYGLGGWQTAIANRWRCQINENSKLLAFVNAFPEMNHNEIVGWAGTKRQNLHPISVLVFGDGNESPRMRERMRVTTELITPSSQVFELLAQGDTLLEKMLFLAHLGDYVSLYLAVLGEQDPSKIDSIDRLKRALSDL